MIKSRSFTIIVIGCATLMGVLIMYFLPISASSQIPYFPKYNTEHSSAQSNNDNKNDNSTVIWPKRNTTTNGTSPDNETDKKSVSTKTGAATPNITSSFSKLDKFAIKEIYP